MTDRGLLCLLKCEHQSFEMIVHDNSFFMSSRTPMLGGISTYAIPNEDRGCTSPFVSRK